MKALQDLRGCFVSSEAEDAGGLTPGKDDNEAGRKADRKDVALSCEFNYRVRLAEVVKL